MLANSILAGGTPSLCRQVSQNASSCLGGLPRTCILGGMGSTRDSFKIFFNSENVNLHFIHVCIWALLDSFHTKIFSKKKFVYRFYPSQNVYSQLPPRYHQGIFGAPESVVSYPAFALFVVNVQMRRCRWYFEPGTSKSLGGI